MTDFAPLSQFSQALAATVAGVAERVVHIDDDGRPLSGLIWDRDLIVTAEERLTGEDGLSATLPDRRTVPAEVAGRDPSTDVALLRADTGAAGVWPQAAAPDIGSIGLVVGRDAGGPLAAFGIVGETGRAWTSVEGGRIDARVRLSFALGHRLEGGAAVNPEGGLLGLAVADPWRRALVIPVTTVARSVEILREKGYVSRGYLGLKLQPLRGATGGLVVSEIDEGAPAAEAGLIVGDIVTTWDGDRLGSVRELARRLGPDEIGRKLRLGIQRAGSPMEVEVTIGERPRGSRSD
jgi:S1-C subfamily serine protease